MTGTAQSCSATGTGPICRAGSAASARRAAVAAWPRVLPGEQVGVQVGDVLGGGDDVDVVPHRHHAGHPGVGDLGGQRPVRPDPRMHIPPARPPPAARPHRAGWPVPVAPGSRSGSPGARALRCRRTGRRSAPAPARRWRSAAAPASGPSASCWLVPEPGSSKIRYPCWPCPDRARHRDPVPQRRHPDPASHRCRWPGGGGRARRPGFVGGQVGQVEVGAVAVEMHHMVGAARVGGLVQHLGQPGEGGRAQHVQVAGRPSGRRRRGPAGRPPTGTAHRPARRAGRSPAAPAAHPRPPPAARTCPRPAGGCGRTPPPPAPARYRCPGRAAAPTAARAPRPGRCPPPPAPAPSRARAWSQIPAASIPANTRAEQARAGLRQDPLGARAPAPGPGRRGTPRNPPGTSGPSPHPAQPPGSAKVGHRHLPGRTRPARSPPPAAARAKRHVADPQHRA